MLTLACCALTLACCMLRLACVLILAYGVLTLACGVLTDGLLCVGTVLCDDIGLWCVDSWLVC